MSILKSTKTGFLNTASRAVTPLQLAVLQYRYEWAHGIDLSHWQRYFDAGVAAESEFGVDFIIQKITEGSTWVDPLVRPLHENIQPIYIRGAYHYFRSAWDWKRQADHFLDLYTNLGGYHFAALDVEVINNLRSGKFAADAGKWMEYVKAETKQEVVLYTNPNVYVNWLDFYNMTWMREYPLWLAQYWFVQHPAKDPGWKIGNVEMKRDPDDWLFYQYSADVPANRKGAEYGVGSTNVDLNATRKTRSELAKLFGVEDVVVTPPPVENVELEAALDDMQATVERHR